MILQEENSKYALKRLERGENAAYPDREFRKDEARFECLSSIDFTEQVTFAVLNCTLSARPPEGFADGFRKCIVTAFRSGLVSRGRADGDGSHEKDRH